MAPAAGPFEVVVRKRSTQLMRLQLLGSGWVSTAEIRTGRETHIEHTGVALASHTEKMDGLPFDCATLVLPPASPSRSLSATFSGH